MSIRAYTDDAAGLLTKVKKLIDQKHITTWAYDNDGDFTHTTSSGQWKNKAWFRPESQSDKLRLKIIAPKTGIEREVFAVYHGRFIEMLAAHVSDKYSSANATSNPADDEPSLQD